MSKAQPEEFPKISPEKVRDSRNPLSELREAQLLLQTDEKRADQMITKEVRDHCRPEIDEYVDCSTGRTFSMFICKDLAAKMRRCLIKYKTDIDIDQRRSELIEELERKGETLDRDMLSRRNNLFKPSSK